MVWVGYSNPTGNSNAYCLPRLTSASCLGRQEHLVRLDGLCQQCSWIWHIGRDTSSLTNTEPIFALIVRRVWKKWLRHTAFALRHPHRDILPHQLRHGSVTMDVRARIDLVMECPASRCPAPRDLARYHNQASNASAATLLTGAHWNDAHEPAHRLARLIQHGFASHNVFERRVIATPHLLDSTYTLHDEGSLLDFRTHTLAPLLACPLARPARSPNRAPQQSTMVARIRRPAAIHNGATQRLRRAATPPVSWEACALVVHWLSNRACTSATEAALASVLVFDARCTPCKGSSA